LKWAGLGEITKCRVYSPTPYICKNLPVFFLSILSSLDSEIHIGIFKNFNEDD
jgi:hypothetical protein